MKIIHTKEITSDNGYILPYYAGNNTVTFFAELPKTAVVDSIEVDGVFLEDLGGLPVYHRKLMDEHRRQVATVYFPDGIPAEFLNAIDTYRVTTFTVRYYEQAVVGV